MAPATCEQPDSYAARIRDRIAAMNLMREVRFLLGGPPEMGPVRNSWAGTDGDRLGAFCALRVMITGPVDNVTGYVGNISDIDRVCRARLIPELRRGLCEWPTNLASVACAMRDLWPIARDNLQETGPLSALTLRPTPYFELTIERGNESMVSLTESFEFSASHRLYTASLSEEENRRLFGKCANPNGHGHNYVLEVTVAGSPDAQTGTLISLSTLEETVNRHVIDRFDHKYLNLDCDEFASLNPSVENIARVVWEKLAGKLTPSQLTRVRVWETPKTFAEYSGEDNRPSHR